MTDGETATFYVNQGLFSDHYLRERMGDHPEWAEDVAPLLEEVRQLFRGRRRLIQGANEARTEQEFIRPMLDLLGYHYLVQTSADHQGRRGIPDYALFGSEAARVEAAVLAGEPSAFYSRVLAIAEAKSWGRPLDKAIASVIHDNPSFQIVGYLVGTGVTWGILTNGKVWRLYYEKARGRAATFYQADLLGLIERGDSEAFRHFWLLFRRQALVPDASGKCFLERVLEGSATYTTRVQDTLKAVVFDQVMPRLAEGFVAWQRDMRGEAEESQGSLAAIQRATLTLLYRLLFLLYAEARDLLPARQRAYYRYSLSRLKARVADELDTGTAYSGRSAQLWEQLKALFNIVNQGDPALGVPVYNGGLFRPHTGRAAQAIQLDDLAIADAYFAPALDCLTRRDDPDLGRRVAIDYRDLEVRHLGSIYEGLLQFRLRLDDQGHVELVHDRGERKATGSYYTPDYIVDYIVTHTLGPLMEERAKRFGELMAQVVELRRRLKAAGNSTANGPLREQLTRVERQAIDALLDVKVCDPAMGSGHFLVRAVDYLTDQVIHILGEYPERNPVVQMIHRVRESIIESLKGQGLTPDLDRLSDTNLLRRLVMKRCVYGVDLNPMAVELAKVGLWLHSFTVGAPLSFLDHHLRCGNSLIGARVEAVRQRLEEKRVGEAAGQYELFGGRFARLLDATALMREVAGLSDASFGEVERSGAQFEAFEEAVLPYKRVLDLWVARHFGVREADSFLRLHGGDILEAVMGRSGSLSPEYGQALNQTHVLQQERRFCHWELEFPEVFVDLEQQRWKEDPGFDAVLGNPPYSLLQGTDQQKPLAALYPAVFSGSNDLSHFFLARGSELLRSGGSLSFIVTRYWMEAHFTAKLRGFLTSFVQPARIVDFGNLQVWPDVNVLAILCFFRRKPVEGTEVYVAGEGSFSTALEFFTKAVVNPRVHPLVVGRHHFGSAPWYLRAIEGASLWAKVQANAVSLGTITKNTQGIKTGSNEAFTVSRQVAEELGLERNALVPLAQAQDLHRYHISVEDYLIYTDGSCDIEEVPRIKAHLLSYKDALSVRAECNRGLYPWWRLQRPRDREMVLHGPRILVPLYATENRFFFSRDVVVGMTDVYLLVITDKRYHGAFLSAVLNSRLLNRYHSSFCKFKRAGYLEYAGNAISALPIRRILFKTPQADRSARVQAGSDLAGVCIETNDPVPMVTFVSTCLGAQPEQSDVVHDLLALLAERMIEMSRSSEDEVAGFARWLVDYTGFPMAQRELRGTVQRFCQQPWDEFLRTLRRNASRMTRDPESREALAKIKEEWDGSRRRLAPLVARIEATDRLIDLIVYRLYGLTEEEVAIVEGQGPPRTRQQVQAGL